MYKYNCFSSAKLEGGGLVLVNVKIKLIKSHD